MTNKHKCNPTKKLFDVLMVATMCSHVVSGQNNRTLTDSEKILGLSRLWEGIRSNYVYYDQLKFDWDSLYAASIPKVLETKDPYTYCMELQRLAASVDDGHTYVSHNAAPPNEDRITPAPFTTEFVGGKILVDKVWSSMLEEKGVKRGIEVITINGVDAIEYGEKQLGQYVSSSTPQWLHDKVFNAYALTKGKRREHIVIGFKDGKKQFSLDIDRNMRWDIQDREAEQQRNAPEEEDFTMKYTVLENNIGVLKINHFMDRSFNQLFDEIYPDILSSDALIIDLRDNGGGNSGYADYILRHLSDKPIRTSSWSSRMYIPAHASWYYGDEWYATASGFLKPADKDIYKNPIVLLVNAGTFSSSEDFCVKFRGMERGKIIGTPTGGSTGNGVRVTLIEGMAMASICAKKDIAPDGTVFVGVGVIPDIMAQKTKESFLSGKDLVLARAIQEVSGN